MALSGLHHVTAVCSDAARTTKFYTRILGLRLVKKTVNFDDPFSYHLYFGDETGSPGSLITFFEWPNAPRGTRGIGATHHLAFHTQSDSTLLQWKRWLVEHGISVDGPYDRRYFRSIYFNDPDGLILEIAASIPQWTVDEPETRLGSSLIQPLPRLTIGNRDEALIASTTSPDPVESITSDMKLQRIHHITAIGSDIDETTRFYTDVLEMSIVKRTLNYDNLASPHYYFDAGDGGVVTYFAYSSGAMRRGHMGTGLTHHFALAVDGIQEQLECRTRLLKAGLSATPVIDRVYFTSVYFHDPDGHIVEIATKGPGFLIDEPEESLGSELRLPSWLEDQRSKIEDRLVPLHPMGS